MSGESAYRILVHKCPNCGAQLRLEAGDDFVCEYCQTRLTRVVMKPPTAEPAAKSQADASPPSKQAEPQPAPKTRRPVDIDFQRQVEPGEQAFSVMVPQGWQISGGVIRPDIPWHGGYSPAMSAKIDFSVMQDAQATVAVRWLPDMVYVDARVSGMGMMYPPGSTYNGMMVYPVMPAAQFLSQVVVPNIHPQAQQVNIAEQRPLPVIAQGYQQRMMAAMPFGTSSYDAGMIIATYQENGVQFKETVVTVIENTGAAGGGMWGNKETLLMRAPVDAYPAWEPAFNTIQQSVELSSQWISHEVRQLVNMGMVMMNNAQIQMYVQSIIQNHQATKAAINEQLFPAG